MLQNARPGYGALFRHMPDQHDNDAGVLGKILQPGGRFTHLGDTARGRIQVLVIGRLDTVYNSEDRTDGRDVLQDGLQTGFRDQKQVLGFQAKTLGSHFNLPGALLAGNIQDGPMQVRCLSGNLQQQGGLSDARIAADENQRAGDKAAAQYT